MKPKADERLASTGTEADRQALGVLELIRALTGRQRGGVLVGVFAAAGLSLTGILGFLQEAPELLSSNSRAIAENTDAIGELTTAVSVNQEAIGDLSAMAQSIQSHFTEEAAANLVRDRQLTYLVCLRTERARELEGLPPVQDCFALSLTGGSP